MRRDLFYPNRNSMCPAGAVLETGGVKCDRRQKKKPGADFKSLRGSKQAAYYIKDLGFPNAYTLSKHMAEDLVTDLHLKPFPVSIVRPSIIGCLAYSPVPGYFGNAAGLTNMILAFASGEHPLRFLLVGAN
jgi:Male sterility protein